MGKPNLRRVLECLSLSSGSSSSLFVNSNGNKDEYDERKPLFGIEAGEKLTRMKDEDGGYKTLVSPLKPKVRIFPLPKLHFCEQRPQEIKGRKKKKMVVLRVSMHCNGCARKVEKHVSRMEGVSSCQVDLETKKVIVTGNILPFQVLEMVSRIKSAELLTI